MPFMVNIWQSVLSSTTTVKTSLGGHYSQGSRPHTYNTDIHYTDMHWYLILVHLTFKMQQSLQIPVKAINTITCFYSYLANPLDFHVKTPVYWHVDYINIHIMQHGMLTTLWNIKPLFQAKINHWEWMNIGRQWRKVNMAIGIEKVCANRNYLYLQKV